MTGPLFDPPAARLAEQGKSWRGLPVRFADDDVGEAGFGLTIYDLTDEAARGAWPSPSVRRRAVLFGPVALSLTLLEEGYRLDPRPDYADALNCVWPDDDAAGLDGEGAYGSFDACADALRASMEYAAGVRTFHVEAGRSFCAAVVWRLTPSGWRVKVFDEAEFDDLAVDAFAERLKAKLAVSREKGRNGWYDPELCADDGLANLLLGHACKGDPLDVAAFAMMLDARGVTGNGGPLFEAAKRGAADPRAWACKRCGASYAQPRTRRGDGRAEVAQWARPDLCTFCEGEGA